MQVQTARHAYNISSYGFWCNLSLISTLSKKFGIQTGVSDHSLDPLLVPLISVAAGGRIIEKHITLSKETDGLDDPVALTPDQFSLMTSKIRELEQLDHDMIIAELYDMFGEDTIETIMGDGEKKLAPSEEQNYTRTNRSIHVMGDMKAGQRIRNYYKSGTGSGGMVNVSGVVDIPEGLKLSGAVKVDSELEKLYKDWEKENPYEIGLGWGGEPDSQKEMPVDDDTIARAASKNDTALVIIGRTAGEDRDIAPEEGSWKLTKDELSILRRVKAAFKETVVILNVGNVIDMSFVADYIYVRIRNFIKNLRGCP